MIAATGMIHYKASSISRLDRTMPLFLFNWWCFHQVSPT